MLHIAELWRFHDGSLASDGSSGNNGDGGACGDMHSVLEAQATAEAVVGLLQVTQGSFAANGGNGHGAHKQLFEREGARGRHL